MIVDDAVAGMSELYAELFAPAPLHLTPHPIRDGYDDLVIAREIPFVSVCARHFLPFMGVAHVGYVPDRRMLDVPQVVAIVDHHARRLQQQSRLTDAILEELVAALAPRGAGVVVHAEHVCEMVRDGGRSMQTVTSQFSGTWRDDAAARREFRDRVR